MTTPLWIKKMLEQRGVPYRESHHAEAVTAQEVAQHEHVTGHRVVKVVVAVADGKPIELVLPAARKVDLDRLRTLMGVHDLRLASEAEMASMFPGCEVGAVPPLDNWPGIPVIMDRSMDVKGEILFQAGTHEDAVRVRFDDWFRVVHPRVEEFSTLA